ncbi:MAG: hypothetical protein OXN86_06700 [Chloroflexota bacterium]|nr:hypothetical protein [Chloroflexota bacterium]
MSPQVVINLWHDFAELCRLDLAARGHHIAGYEDEKVVWLFLNANRNSIEPIPRSVQRSSVFSCPKEHEDALSVIEQKIERGEDINPHRSKLNKDPGNINDELLNHWGIYHLHLGLDIGDDGFADRTGPLIYCRFDSENAFLIGIYSHGVWTHQDLLQIVHDNWPESISHWKGRALSGDTLTDGQVKNLRKNRVNHAVTMTDDTVYLPPGGGVTAAGSNTLDVLHADCLKQWAQSEEEKILEKWDAITERAADRDLAFGDPAELRLEIHGETFFAVETLTNYELALLDPESYCR